MFRGTKLTTDVEPISLTNAVLCVDCESVSASRFDACPVCGGHSLLGLSRMLGGPMSAYREDGSKRSDEAVVFNVEMTIKLNRVNAAEFSAVVGEIASVIAPRIGRDRASFHVDVEPVIERRDTYDVKAA